MHHILCLIKRSIFQVFEIKRKQENRPKDITFKHYGGFSKYF